MQIYFTPQNRLILFFIINLLFIFSSSNLLAQSDCAIGQFQGQGYTTSISAVTDNSDGSFTVVLIVENDGCPGPDCKKLNSYSVEADAGTYSDISVDLLSGNFSFASINNGPNLGGAPFDGFRINNTNGMGNGQAASFSLTYTLTGGLQDQQVLVKAGSDDLIISFTIAEFESVLDCEGQNIFPYYTPPPFGKTHNLIGAELTSLYNTYIEGGSYMSDDIFQIIDTGVVIDVIVKNGKYDSTLALLTTPEYGLTLPAGDPEQNIITGLYPIVNLMMLNELHSLINFARPVYRAISNSGIVTSQGDTAMRSYFARNGFNVTGQGIKIGVLSDSYNTRIGNPAHDDVLRGDLPGPENPENTIPVDVVLDYPYGTRSDEGRAMLHIIHDIAPGAQLAFRTGFLGVTDFAKGINDLQQDSCDIIVDDITYISEPFFRDGLAAQAVDNVTALGVTYFSAAGNFGSRSYQSEFYPSAAPSGIVGEAHNFAGAGGGPDIYQNISLTAGNYTVVLQWDDGTAGNLTNTDFDIYLSKENGATLFGFNRVNTGGAPIEVLPFTVTGDNTQTNFMIIRASGTGAATLKYIVFRGNIVINEYGNTGGSSTLVGQANAEGAIAVGAVLYLNTPEYNGVPPTVASFSSRGGTPVNGTPRNKPDITAPNGVNTNVDLGGVNIEEDPFPNFFGTSAAAPHGAGVAALIQEARDKFYGSSLSPAGIKAVLQNSAIDMYTPGYDPESGAGFIQADAALLTMANPSPYITGISYDTTLTPGVDPIVITVYGQYLTEESKVYFNGAPLENATIVIGDTMVSSTIPVFDLRYPEIQVYNPPMAGTNGTDGGLSNPLYFETKETVVVSIDDKSKKYGEVLPEFSAEYFLESIEGSISLDSAGFTQAELDRIHSVAFETVADPLSNVGLWEIKADIYDPLNPLSDITPLDSTDISLLERYNFVFERGLLNIEKLDLVITPHDTTFIYGDAIGGFSFEYSFNHDSINLDNGLQINVADSLAILSALTVNHATALVNGTALTFATALVNAGAGATALVNKSFMISNATFGSYATALVNGAFITGPQFVTATALVNTVTFTGSSALAPATALVNGDVMVNSYIFNGDLKPATALVNSEALVNGAAGATALVNSNTFNADNNSDAIVIMGDGDITVLSGDSTGYVDLLSMNIITGNTVGQHYILPGSLISNNFNISYGLGILNIEPATAVVIIDPESLTHIYDGTGKSVSVSTDPTGLDVVITYDGSSEGPVNAGSYLVNATVNDPNYLGEASNTLVINPVTATVTADFSVIDKGDALPAFTATFDGFLDDDDESVVSSLTFTVSPVYNGNAGIYEIIPAATADNYIFTPVNGTLYVNAAGPGTKQIKTRLACVEELTVPDSSGFSYIAHFEYDNDNSTDVFIFIGAENYFSGDAEYNGINQPELFVSGGGEFSVPFDGEKLVWTVISYKNNGHKSSVASQASSSSSKCNKSNEAETLPIVSDDQNNTGPDVYPNPTTGKVFIKMHGEIVTGQDITVYDLYGRMLPLQARLSSDQQIEVDLTGYTAGLYIVRINSLGTINTYRIIKK